MGKSLTRGQVVSVNMYKSFIARCGRVWLAVLQVTTVCAAHITSVHCVVM